MGNHDALAGSIAVPTLFFAVLQDEELVFIEVACDAQGLVGRSIFLVEHGQRVIGAGLWGDVLNPSHEHFLVGRIAWRREAVIVVTSQAHDVPVAHAVVVATSRVVEVRQTQAMAELMRECANAIDDSSIIVAAIQLVEHRKIIHQWISIVGTECTRAAHAIIRGRRQVPVAGPNGLGMVPRSLRLAHTGIDDDHHVAVIVTVGVIGFERYAVGGGQLHGLGDKGTQHLVAVAAAVTTVVLTVLAQRVNAIYLKIWLIQAIGLVTEVLSHALVAREYGIDDFLTGIVELFVFELHQDDGDLARAHSRNARVVIAAAYTQQAFLARRLVGFVLHRQAAALHVDKCILARRALASLVGTYCRQARHRRGVIKVTVLTTGYRQPVTGENSVVKGIAHSLHLQGGAVTLRNGMPSRSSGHSLCDKPSTQANKQ